MYVALSPNFIHIAHLALLAEILTSNASKSIAFATRSKTAGVQLGGWLPQALVDSFVYSNTHNAFFPNVRKVFLKQHQEQQDAQAAAPSAAPEQKHSEHHHKHKSKVAEEQAAPTHEEEHVVEKKKKKKHVVEEEVYED